MLGFPAPYGRLHMFEARLGGYLIYPCRISKGLVGKPGEILTNSITSGQNSGENNATTKFRGDFLQSAASCNGDLTQLAVILLKHDSCWPLWTPHSELSLNPPVPPHVHDKRYKGQYCNNINNNNDKSNVVGMTE